MTTNMEMAPYKGHADEGGFMNNSQEFDSNISLNIIGDKERELLKLVNIGDVEVVQDFLHTYPDVNVNVRDIQGHLPIAIAAQNQHGEMVSLFLQHPDIILGDSILYAIKEGAYKIVEKMLDHQRGQEAKGDVSKPFHSAEFPPHMTPLMYAAHCNAFEIVQLLLQRGHTIEIPDPTKHVESDGSDMEFGESLEYARARIDTYKALASPSYMALSSSDPILAAFKLCHEADKAAYTDPVFRLEYEDLSKQCREFATGLLGECRTSLEVYMLLTQESEGVGIGSLSDYARLELAIEYDQKEFVSHPNCQQVLQMLWTLNNPNVMWMSAIRKLLYFVPRIIILPFIFIGYFFTPCLKVWDYWKAPMFKYLSEVMSYIVFLCLIFVSILRFKPDKRVATINGVDICIYIWIASFVWHYIKIFYLGGFKAFAKNWWFIYDVITVIVFLTAFAGRLASFIIARTNNNVDEHLQRKYWPPFDPMLVSEGFYCLACVMSFGRVLYWFQMSQLVGPMQLSLSQMFYDVWQFFLVFILIIFSFSVGLTRNYSYYRGSVRKNEDGSESKQTWFFESWEATFKTLFWNLYGYGGNDYGDLVVDNRFNKTHFSPVVKHAFTEGMGNILWGIYHILAVTILLNMLIAMMSNTLSRVQENADIEWKFARARTWMFYFERGGFIPPPLNLIPTPATVMILIKWFSLKLCGNSAEAKFSHLKCCFIEREEDLKDKKAIEEKYKKIMSRLIQRYLSRLEQEQDSETVTPAHVDQLRQDLLREVQKVGKAPSRAASPLPLHSPPKGNGPNFAGGISLHVPNTQADSHHL